jgi:hypothetical protein
MQADAERAVGDTAGQASDVVSWGAPGVVPVVSEHTARQFDVALARAPVALRRGRADDYTLLSGGLLTRQPAGELIADWRALLDGVATQHLLGPGAMPNLWLGRLAGLPPFPDLHPPNGVILELVDVFHHLIS